MSSGRERSLKENLGKPAVKVKGTELGIFVSVLLLFAPLLLILKVKGPHEILVITFNQFLPVFVGHCSFLLKGGNYKSSRHTK